MRVEQKPHRSVALPCGQLFFRERVEEAVVKRDAAPHGAELSLAPPSTRDEPRNRRAVSSDGDLLAGLDLCEQARQVGLGLVDVYDRHERILAGDIS